MSYFIYGNVESFFFCMLVQFFFHTFAADFNMQLNEIDNISYPKTQTYEKDFYDARSRPLLRNDNNSIHRL